MKSKKGISFMLDNFGEIVLVVAAIVVFFIGALTVYGILTTSPQELQLKDQFKMFTTQLKAVSYSNSEYSSNYGQILMNNNNYLIGFPKYSGAILKIGMHASIDVKRPSKCNDNSVCFCLYSFLPDSKKRDKNIIICENIPNVDYVFSNKFNYDPIININDVALFFDQSQYSYDLFVGDQLTGEDFNRFVDLFYHTKQFISKSQTMYLGLDTHAENNNFINYFAIRPSYSTVIPLYIEFVSLKNSENKYSKALFIFPYEKALTNRKYYFIKPESSIGDCNNAYLHDAGENPINSGNYSYCELNKNNANLSLHDEQIKLCESGKITDLCVCGNKAVNHGYCLIEYFPAGPQHILYNFPYDAFCDEKPGVVYSCSSYPINQNYEQVVFCNNDICDLSQTGCKVDNNVCVEY